MGGRCATAVVCIAAFVVPEAPASATDASTAVVTEAARAGAGAGDGEAGGGVPARRLEASRRDHCLLDEVNKIVRTTKDFMDWGGSDRLFSKWWLDHVSDYKLDKDFCPEKDFLKCLEGKWREDEDGVTVLQAGGDGVCKVAMMLEKAPRPYVYVTPAENWGALSAQTYNRTANWNYWTDPRWCYDERDTGTVVESAKNYVYTVKDVEAKRSRLVRDWLEDVNLRLVFTTQHQQIVRHPKIVSFPLGIRRGNIPWLLTLIMGAARPPRRRLLLINNSGWQFRSGINDLVARNFDPPLKNLYCTKKRCPVAVGHVFEGEAVSEERYRQLMNKPPDVDAFYAYHPYGQILTSKFVLCPPGLGADSYRIWEVIYLGAIPVIERTGGAWDDIFVDLPVLFVDDFSEVTKPFLDAAYARLLGRCGKFNSRKITKKYWLDIIRRQGSTKLGPGHRVHPVPPRDGNPFHDDMRHNIPAFLTENLPADMRPPQKRR